MELHSFLRSRRSIRRFKPTPVPRAAIERILTTATFAPSAHNRQPWRFRVLTEPSTKSALADVMADPFRRDLERDGLVQAEVEARLETSRTRISSAPVVIVVCMDTSEMDVYPDATRAESERVMALQSTANAAHALLLAAHAEGLGGVWNCAPLFAPAAVKVALRLPTTWEPQAMLLIGVPAETPAPRTRKPLGEIAIIE